MKMTIKYFTNYKSENEELKKEETIYNKDEIIKRLMQSYIEKHDCKIYGENNLFVNYISTLNHIIVNNEVVTIETSFYINEDAEEEKE